MAKDIQVVIIGKSDGEECEGYCGVDWSLAENIIQAKERIQARFGDRVNLKYLDLTKSGGETSLMRKKAGKQTLPLLLINGEARISGQFDLRMLLDAIEAEIELKQE